MLKGTSFAGGEECRLYRMLQPSRGSSGEHDFYDFGEQEWRQSESEGLLPASRGDLQPRYPRSEQQGLSHDPGENISRQGRGSALCQPSCNKGDHRIRQQIAPRGAKKLDKATDSHWAENRQAHRSPCQVKSGCRESALASQRQANQQHAKISQGKRNRREG